MDEDLMEEVVKPERYEVALAAVTRNGGVPGIDGMTGTELVGHPGQICSPVKFLPTHMNSESSSDNRRPIGCSWSTGASSGPHCGLLSV